LSLKLSYNWHFDIEDQSPEAASRIFSTPDFTGDICKAIGSLVRGAVASSTFDDFHKHSSEIIHSSVFGKNVSPAGIKPDSGSGDGSRLFFSANSLAITNIDVQSVEPVDQRTLDSLQKSVQLAIEITTKSQEATARQEAERLEQEARGRLERQKISDEAEAERSRRRLIELQAQSSAVESTGQATAEAKARAEAAQIEGEAEVRQARLAAEAARIKHETDLEQLKLQQEAQLSYKQRITELELAKAKELSDIEGQKFKDIVDAIGADTIKAIAQAGPEMQAKLLSVLGLQGFMITDGHSPINLFNTANGFVGGLPGVPSHPGRGRASSSSVASDDF